MGICSSKHKSSGQTDAANQAKDNPVPAKDNEMEEPTKNKEENPVGKKSKFFPFHRPGHNKHLFAKKAAATKEGTPATTKEGTPATTKEGTKAPPKRFFRKAFPPLSPAKHVKAVLMRRHGTGKGGNGASEGEEVEEAGLNKNFGFSKHFGNKYELGEEVGRGHFGYTCRAKFKKGEMKGQMVAVKIIRKAKMTTAIAIEDVQREVKILQTLTGHSNLIRFYDAYEDHDRVYIVLELCEGGELLDRILSRGGKFKEDDAKGVLIQILSVVAFCHLQGVVHRDLKPENFLFASKIDDSQLKVIDFGLSDFIKPDDRLDDIVGSAYYVAPEVLQRCYDTEADIWSIGVMAYILLCGSRPFWARTESGIFRAVLKTEPGFEEITWPKLSPDAKDFVKCLLTKDPRRRLTAAQALCHPWIRSGTEVKTPFDISILKFVKAFMRASDLRQSALRALSKTLTFDELFYLKEQFSMLDPDNTGSITIENFKTTLTNQATDAMKEARIHEFVASLSGFGDKKMDFDEFCAAGLSVYQLEGFNRWDEQARGAFEIFEKVGNRAIMVEELASELGLGSAVPVHAVFDDSIRKTDGRLSYVGFLKVLHGVSNRTPPRPR